MKRSSAAALLALALALAALVGASGCSTPSSAPTGGTAAEPSATSAPSTASPEATQTGVPLAQLKLSLSPMWRGFDEPVYLTNAGDGSGRLFVVEQTGKVKVVAGGQVQQAPYLDLSALTKAGGEQGLLGIAFAPEFAANGRLYVNYTDLEGNTVVARYTAPDPASNAPAWTAPQRILSVKQPYSNHNGGCLQFGPDEMLCVGLGDGGSGGDPQRRAKNPAELLGKMLRLDVGETAGGTPKASGYEVPADNPFVGKAGYRPEIWSLGLRNPWRYSFDAKTGALWIGDVGQNAWEEIDYAPPGVGGQNWGWNEWEGTHPYPDGARSARKGYTFPVLDYSHADGSSVTGGYVYRGTAQPSLAGTYLYADFGSGFIGGIRLESPDGATLTTPEKRVLLKSETQPSSFGVDEAGEIYLVDYTGTVWAVRGEAR